MKFFVADFLGKPLTAAFGWGRMAQFKIETSTTVLRSRDYLLVVLLSLTGFTRLSVISLRTRVATPSQPFAISSWRHNMTSTVPQSSNKLIWQVILSSAVGTVIEWYDFYIFGSLAATIGPVLFGTSGKIEETLLGALAVFGAGFIVRPFGAIVFGRIGDMIGRKYAFLMTLLIMGGATFLTGLIPSFEQIGIWAAVAALVLRLAQGLALGGEYGGAAVYVAEHVPDNQRGYYTSYIQITATAGLLLSLLVILAVRSNMSTEDFNAWGWRIPFLLSALLVGLSVYIRLKLKESPLFENLKATGKTSSNPLRDTFKNANVGVMLTVLFGAAAGQAVVWYTGQFYALSWLKTSVFVNATTADQMVAIALALGAPFFVFFGWLSDRVGRKPVMMAGCLIAALAFLPLFGQMANAVGPAKFLIDSKGPAASVGKFADDNIAAQYTKLLNDSKVSGVAIVDEQVKALGLKAKGGKAVKEAVAPNAPVIVGLLFILVFFVTMVYGPIAAFLVESFPAQIRYSSVSIPYHIGNGWFGGLLPLIATAITTSTGNIYAGLYYPIGIALMTFVVGMIWLRESKHVSIHNTVENTALNPAD
jgi:MFS family permease